LSVVPGLFFLHTTSLDVRCREEKVKMNLTCVVIQAHDNRLLHVVGTVTPVVKPDMWFRVSENAVALVMREVRKSDLS
jgi:hypothetical protein